MVIVEFLGGLRRFGARHQFAHGATVRAILTQLEAARPVLFPDGERLNPDVVVLLNGRNIEFLSGLDTQLSALDPQLSAHDRLVVFLHGARGYPGG